MSQEKEDLELKLEPRWYVIHTYSGYENKVKADLEKKVKNQEMEEFFFDIVVPMEEQIEIKEGKRKTNLKKVFPGYVLIKMIVTEQTWYIVRNTRGVTGFVGPGSKPVPLTDIEMATLGIRRDNIEIDVEVGDTITVIGGVWKDTVGVVTGINEHKQCVTINVDMFGRETPVEISFAEVKKM